jgi:hypothetical protein
MTKRVEKAASQLVEAAAEDMKLQAELEKSGVLFEGYHSGMRALHEKNAQLLQAFLASYGWPFPSRYGEQIHEAAWIIAIHAISRPSLVKAVLHMLEQGLYKGECVAQEYAKTFDRVALYEGRQQRYGTQFFPSPTGWIARDLEDPEQVDDRRAALGLPPFLENKRHSGAEAGGVLTEAQLEHYNTHFTLFLKEVGWR